MGAIESFKSFIKLLYYFVILPEKKFSRFPYLNLHEGKKAMVFGNGPSVKNLFEDYKNGDAEIINDSFFVNYAPLDPLFYEIKPKHFFLSDYVFSRDTHDSRTAMTRRMYDDLEKIVDWDLSIYLCFPRKEDGEELISFSRIKNPKIHFVFLNRKHCSGLAPSWRHYLYKKGLFMPEEGTVVNTAIYVALIEGYKEIELYGVEHSMFLNLRLNDQHKLYNIQKNFYDKEETLVPVTNDGSFEQAKIHNYMNFICVMFNSHYLLRQFADYMGARIINCTPDSMIDVYEFKNTDK